MLEKWLKFNSLKSGSMQWLPAQIEKLPLKKNRELYTVCWHRRLAEGGFSLVWVDKENGKYSQSLVKEEEIRPLQEQKQRQPRYTNREDAPEGTCLAWFHFSYPTEVDGKLKDACFCVVVKGSGQLCLDPVTFNGGTTAMLTHMKGKHTALVAKEEAIERARILAKADAESKVDVKQEEVIPYPSTKAG